VTHHFRRTCIISILQKFSKYGSSSRIVSADIFEGRRQTLDLSILAFRPRHHFEDAIVG
jgi:hypothetical protein